MKKKSGLWKILTPIFAVLLIIFVVGTFVANSYRAVIDTFFDISTYKIVSVDGADVSETEYFKSPYVMEDASWNGLKSKNGEEAYYDNDALRESDYAMGEEVEGEGAVLLFNYENALPLDKGNKVSAFGISSNNLSYAGFGSGGVDASTAPKLKTALAESGLEVNPTLADFYENGAAKDYKRSTKSFFQTGEYGINEAPWSIYTDDVKNSFASYGDAAIMVITREGGEDNDLPRTNSDFEASREASANIFESAKNPFNSDTSNDGKDGNYLSLSEDERELLRQLTNYKNQGVFKKVVVLINSSNALQFDFLQDSAIDVDAALWIGSVGYTGICAVADILVGDVTPSGSLPDTFYKDNMETPAMVNFGKTKFANWTEEMDKLGADCYTVYEEGIYTGYKYTESRYFDLVMGQNNAGNYNYDSLVAFPFGHGESYTSFEYGDMEMKERDDGFEISVKVTNTGDVKGKEVVQIYMSSPYTEYDKANQIEKSAVELVGFGKTQILQPGASETVTVRVEKEVMKAYDAFGAKTYIVDDGDYCFVAARNAHKAANNLLAYEGKKTTDGMDGEGDAELVSVYHQDKFDDTTYGENADGYAVTNQFDDADLRIYEDGAQAEGIQLLSRRDWKGTYPQAENHAAGTLRFTQKMEEDVSRGDAFTVDEDVDATMPAYGAKNGLTLAGMRGLDYDDPKWDLLLDQMTYEEQAELCSQGYHQTVAVESIAKPATKDENGPVGLTRTFMGSETRCMAYPSCPVMGATMNTELINRMGQQIGLDALHANFQGLYGPGVNIHRTPYCGRNFEYFSEDSMLSGLICQAETLGIQSKGMYVYAKHFALNDQETLRHGICTFASEQTIRENYLKAFEYVLAADKGNGHAAMTSFNRIGVVWAGAHEGLLTNVLRGEWGFDGFTITDCWTDIGESANSGNYFGNAARAVLAGGDTLDGTPEGAYNDKALKNSPTFCQALRESTKRICYVQANSSAMNGLASDFEVARLTSWWQTALYAVDAVLAVLVALCVVMLARSGGRKEKK